MERKRTGSKEPKMLDQQLMEELLEEERISRQYEKPQEVKPEEVKNKNFFTENFAKKTPALATSAILSGLDGDGIPKDFLSQAHHWVQQHPLETILGAIVIGGIGYKLYQHFTKKAEPETQEAMKSRLSRARRKRMRERKRTFMEKAKDLFHSENEKGELSFDLGKTVTAVSVAGIGAITGVIASKKSLPVTLLGATSLAIGGYGLNSPLVSLGAIGVAVGAFVSELVRKTVKRSSTVPEETNPDITKVKEGDLSAKLNESVTAEPPVNESNAIEGVLRNEKEHNMKSKEDFIEFDRMMKQLQQEELPELA